MHTARDARTLTGISVRALHHYDTVGLLQPTHVTAADYRRYDDVAMVYWQINPPESPLASYKIPIIHFCDISLSGYDTIAPQEVDQ